MESETYSYVKTTVRRLLKIDLSYYKDEQMKRRLDSWLVRNSMPNWNDYLKVITENPTELARFRDYLTINVTEFFRDPDRWHQLGSQILPALLKAHTARSSLAGLKTWSAGCSIGVEAYTMAMLLDETARYRKHTVLATDLDRSALQKARARGPYTKEEGRNLLRQRYLDEREDGSFLVKESLFRMVEFREHDLLQDRYESGFDLIVCRNVVIYFTNEAKSSLYARFAAALRPGGVLFLGGTEIIPRPADYGLCSMAVSFYQKE